MSQSALASASAVLSGAPPIAKPSWQSLPPLPDKHGFAGSFVGVSRDALLVAGGANFPAAPLWEGGRKVWSDQVFVLENPTGEWKIAGKLPGPRGYGVSISTADGLLCIAGNDAERHHADCTLVEWKNGGLEIREFPPLPLPLADMTGALVGTTVHLVGGTRAPGATTAEKIHLSLDLDDLEKGWHQQEFPGAARVLAVSASQSGAFFVMSGAALAADAEGKTQRTYLRDAWRHDPTTGWQALPDLPRAVLAAPSPATVSGPRCFLILGGDDGSRAGFQPVSAHPGFPRSILCYDTAARTWTENGHIPANLPAPVTTSTTIWHNRTVIPSGEVRPATRTPEVTAFATDPNRL